MTEDDLHGPIVISLTAVLGSINAFMQKWVKVNINLNIFNSDFFLIIIIIYIFHNMEVK